MEFKRKRIRGRNQQTYREWYDESRQYQIRWRKEWQGIPVLPAYYSLVRCVAGESVIWDFVGRQGPYKTFNKAVEEAERNRKVWNRYLELANGPRKGRMDNIRALDFKARGIGRRILSSVPVWVRETDFAALRFLTPTSMTIDESSPEEIGSETILAGGPVLSVVEKQPSPIPSSASQEACDHPSPVRDVEAAEKAPKKRARKPSKKLLTTVKGD